MENKINEAFYLLLGVLGLTTALAILLTIVRIGELLAEWVVWTLSSFGHTILIINTLN